MPKTVAVMRGLDHVADELRRHGIKVVDVEEVNVPISALVYSSQVSQERLAGNHMVPPAHALGGGVDDLVQMLNADTLSAQEIIARIKGMW